MGDKERYRVTITQLPKDGMNDPQGEVVADALKQLGFEEIDDRRTGVRTGRFLEFEFTLDGINPETIDAGTLAEALLGGSRMMHKFGFIVEKTEDDKE